MTTAPALEIRKTGRAFRVFAGASRLSRSFKTRERAESWANENASFLAYWAGSASVSVDNAKPREVLA
jgi:hypothetical protein